MKKVLIIFITILFKQIILFSQGGFSKNYFLPNSVVSVCTDVIEAPNGNIIMTGLTFDGPTGSNRLTIVGTDANGTELWQKSYGSDKFEYLDNFLSNRSLIKGNSSFYFYSCVRDSNNKYPSVLIKFNFNGDTLWQKKFYDTNDYLYIQGVAKSVDDGFLITGFCAHPVNPIETTLIIKTDSNGNELWRKKINKPIPNGQNGSNIIQDSLTKKIVIAGYQYDGTASAYTGHANIIVTDSLGTVLQRKTFSGGCSSFFIDLIQTKDKKCVAVGQNDQCDNLGGPNGTARHKGYALKFDLNNLNNVIWTKEFDQTCVYNSINTINELSNGDLILGGRYDTLKNYSLPEKVMLRLIKTDKDGNVKWNKNLSRDNSNENSKFIRSLNVTSSGSYLTANWLYFAANPKPYSITKIDSMGCDSTVVYCQTVGLNENTINKNILSIYPNPTNDILNIEIENFNHDQNLTIKVVDILGRAILEIPFKEQINLKDLKYGVYFLELYDKQKLISSRKIIKQ
ncbi:MAG: T9SS type A sorting domain-containing protein [Bacteroidia bacterium]|nr:T9SS type A sorting domain-containing protein [Bacteroidia bacterium]